MNAFLFKTLVTALLVAAISEAAKRSTLLGALLASLPLTSLLAIIWLYRDTGEVAQTAALATGIFWMVLPSLALFIVFPLAVRAGLSFWPSLGSGIVATLVAYGVLLAIDRRFAFHLFG